MSILKIWLGTGRCDTTMVNDDFSVNVRHLNADIDLVLNWDSETDQAEQLKALGIPCVLVSSAKDMDGLSEKSGYYAGRCIKL